MHKSRFTLLVVSVVALFVGIVHAQSTNWIDMHHADSLETAFSEFGDTTYVWRDVIFETESAMIYCDSAVWAMRSSVSLFGRVVIDHEQFRLVADDSINYGLNTGQLEAFGSYVELWSREDSLLAVGTHAFYDNDREFFYMLDRPTLYLNYPDTGNMIEVLGDLITYDGISERAEASGTVKISSNELTATAGCAVMDPHSNNLDLFDSPVLIREHSHISGEFISITTRDRRLERVLVIDSARAEFTEPVDEHEVFFDESILSGQRLTLDFFRGRLSEIRSVGQAYSWYYPSEQGGTERSENTVSGDSILFTIEDEGLAQIDVYSGAIGQYLNTKRHRLDHADTLGAADSTASPDSAAIADTTSDSLSSSSPEFTFQTDTIHYQAEHIRYTLNDSLIILKRAAQTTAGVVSLEAEQIELDTKTRIIEAYSAAPDRSGDTTGNKFADKLQPNEIPVRLRDGDQVLVGDYLEYSIDTEKGRIVTSKSKYQTGFFYGEELYRQDRNIYYLDQGVYTTCDADEPHFHFKSNHLKLMEGDKLLAKPVVLNIGRLPILALPFYVFPLDKGRHSGILPFTLGNIERGERYIRNVGYYWAASEYWDWLGALDFYEEHNSLNMYSKVAYRKRYAFNGQLSGNYARETNYSYTTGRERRETRWTVAGNHSHEVSPSFRFTANGSFQSDPSYYNDFSGDLTQRLNRVVRSQLTFDKKFSKRVSLSGKVSHDEHLDTKTRTDQIPSMALSLPAIHPFGSGSTNDDGLFESRWYQKLVATYRPSVLNYSQRTTNELFVNVVEDTLIDTTVTIIVLDSLGELLDTVVTIDTTTNLASRDTLDVRSRKEYTRGSHRLSLSFPTDVFTYIRVTPKLNYSEDWFRVYRSDQSDSLGIDADRFYRSYMYNVGASASTDIYGTVYPNMLGLIGLRQVLTPMVGYSFRPENDLEPIVSSYAGGSARSTAKSQSLNVSLRQTYQAKIKKGEGEQNLDLVTITSGFNYDFERDSQKYSRLATSFSSNVLPKVTFYGNMNHSFYPSDSDEPDIWHPRLTSFSLNSSVSFRGRRFLFDSDRAPMPIGADSAVDLIPTAAQMGQSKGWSMSASYSYSETGLGTEFPSKKSFIRMNLRFNLTPFTEISYSQDYNIAESRTVNNQVTIKRQIHCWSGVFHWVPTGSNRGWGFRLFVTALPAIKVDNSQNTFRSGYLLDQR